MKIYVKQLLAGEHAIEVLPTETILQLKNKISELLGIETTQQTLLLAGKPLSDDNQLNVYPGIREGCKLVLVKKSPQNLMTKSGTQKFKDEIIRVLRKYYSERECQTIAHETVKILKTKANLLSYDDLERLATALILDEEYNSC